VHLARQTDADSDLESELLRMFDVQAAKVSARLAFAELGFQVKADLAHRLRGSALAIGAWRVAKAAEAAEAHFALLVAGRDAAGEPLVELDAAVAEARAEIKRLAS
jgi:HPt (histidine-containing phosphotransfer) domain-containing protein